MTRYSFFVLAAFFLLSACVPAQPTPDVGQINGQVETSVALTITALPSPVPPTNTPLPTPTEVVPPTPTFDIPTIVIPTATLIKKYDYVCDIINQRPFDDTKFRPNESFDVRWVIVNTGTEKWEDGTYLEYQSGPQMTQTTRVKLPKLKPGEQQEIILEATAPADRDMQIMVWAVWGPGTVKDSVYWMCYPYIRIIVGK